MAFSTLGSSTALSPDDADQIQSTAKWARLGAILGFILLGILLLFGLTMAAYIGRIAAYSAAMSGQAMPFNPAVIGLFYGLLFLIIVVVCFFPTLFLYQYASRTLRALRGGAFDAAQFSRGVSAQRSFFAYTGILMIIIVGLYAIAGIFWGILIAMMPSLPAME